MFISTRLHSCWAKNINYFPIFYNDFVQYITVIIILACDNLGTLYHHKSTVLTFLNFRYISQRRQYDRIAEEHIKITYYDSRSDGSRVGELCTHTLYTFIR